MNIGFIIFIWYTRANHHENISTISNEISNKEKRDVLCEYLLDCSLLTGVFSKKQRIEWTKKMRTRELTSQPLCLLKRRVWQVHQAIKVEQQFEFHVMKLFGVCYIELNVKLRPQYVLNHKRWIISLCCFHIHNLPKMSLTKLFIIDIALLEIPVSGWT